MKIDIKEKITIFPDSSRRLCPSVPFRLSFSEKHVSSDVAGSFFYRDWLPSAAEPMAGSAQCSAIHH